MKYLLQFAVLLITFNCPAWSQYYIPENRAWAVSANGGVDFSTSPPFTFHTNMNTLEGCASVCSKEGGLLFYTDGTTVWNASGSIMPHGSNIIGVPGATFSTTQAAVIVPDPQNNNTTINRYYLFSLSSILSRNLSCNVVDMNLDNSDGDIDLTFPLRNVVLHDSLVEKMIAIPGCNNNVWLIVNNGSKFFSYNITIAGINTTPVVSTSNNTYGNGVMKASSDGTKIATCKTNGTGLAVLRFDFTTGIVSDLKFVDSANGNYGCAFSPDGNMLYAGDNQLRICQYDLAALYPAQSKIALGPCVPLDMKLAVNGKIYFISASGNIGEYMGCINNPDAPGANANYQDSVIHFLNGDLAFGLANEVVIAAPLPSNGINRVMLDSFICHFSSSDNIPLHAVTGFNNYVWDNGSTGITRPVSQPGNYHVTYMTPCGLRTDTFKIVSGNSTLNITFSSPTLNASTGYVSYKWYNGNTLIQGANNASLSVLANGWYSVVAVNDHGCIDSASYNVTGLTGINDPRLWKNQINVYPNPTRDIIHIASPVALVSRLYSIDGKLLLTSTGNKECSIKYLRQGLYFLTISDEKGNLIKVEKIIKLQ